MENQAAGFRRLEKSLRTSRSAIEHAYGTLRHHSNELDQRDERVLGDASPSLRRQLADEHDFLQLYVVDLLSSDNPHLNFENLISKSQRFRDACLNTLSELYRRTSGGQQTVGWHPVGPRPSRTLAHKPFIPLECGQDQRPEPRSSNTRNDDSGPQDAPESYEYCPLALQLRRDPSLELPYRFSSSSNLVCPSCNRFLRKRAFFYLCSTSSDYWAQLGFRFLVKSHLMRTLPLATSGSDARHHHSHSSQPSSHHNYHRSSHHSFPIPIPGYACPICPSTPPSTPPFPCAEKLLEHLESTHTLSELRQDPDIHQIPCGQWPGGRRIDRRLFGAGAGSACREEFTFAGQWVDWRV